MSAWNPNGFEAPGFLTPDEHLVQRHSDGVPGVAYLLKRQFWEKHVAPNWRRCCEGGGEGGGVGGPTWVREWRLEGASRSKEMLVPDLSRVFIVTHPNPSTPESSSSATETAVLDELFGRKRLTNLAAEVRMMNAPRLRSADYEANLLAAFKGAKVIDGNSVLMRRCLDMKEFVSNVSKSGNGGRRNVEVSAIKAQESAAIEKWLGKDFPSKEFAKSESKTFVIYVDQRRFDDDDDDDGDKKFSPPHQRTNLTNKYIARKNSDSFSQNNQSKKDGSTQHNAASPKDANNVTSTPNDVNLKDNAIKDHRVFRKLARCFRLFSVEGLPIKGLHDGGMLSFGYKGKRVFLVGTASRYKILMPKGVHSVTLK